MENNKRKRVVCPVAGKDGKTHWTSMGSAFINQDGSWNIYLDGLPVNGRLQVRDWDNPPWKKKEGAPSRDTVSSTDTMRLLAAEPNDDQLPF